MAVAEKKGWGSFLRTLCGRTARPQGGEARTQSCEGFPSLRARRSGRSPVKRPQNLSPDRRESAYRRGGYGGATAPTPCREAPKRGRERPRPIGREERTNPRHKRMPEPPNKYPLPDGNRARTIALSERERARLGKR